MPSKGDQEDHSRAAEERKAIGKLEREPKPGEIERKTTLDGRRGSRSTCRPWANGHTLDAGATSAARSSSVPRQPPDSYCHAIH